jgi:hypothetical protein
MLIVEMIAKIRRAFFVQGKPIKAICRELRISRKVVRKVLRSKAGPTGRCYLEGVFRKHTFGLASARCDPGIAIRVPADLAGRVRLPRPEYLHTFALNNCETACQIRLQCPESVRRAAVWTSRASVS